MTTEPCDVYSKNGEIYLIQGKQLETLDEEPAPNKEIFLTSLIALEPTFEYIFREMPYLEEDHSAIADLMAQENLVAGSDGGDDQNGRLACAIIPASDDLLDYHISGHEVYGEPKDSGRAKITGVTAIILYLCHVIKWYDLPSGTSVTIYCDSAETVKVANDLWMGETLKWADARNIGMKRTIHKMLQTTGRGMRVEYTPGHQDKGSQLEDLPLPAKLNIMCDRKCGQILNESAKEKTQDRANSMMSCTGACLALKGEPITGKINRALARQKYATKVAKHLGMSTTSFDEVDWVSHSRALGLERSPALRRIIWGHHPTRSRLRMQMRSPSGECILCGKKDVWEHFLECAKINDSKAHKKLRDEMRHKSHAQGAPDHLIDTIARVMTGKTMEGSEIPSHARRVYKIQQGIGWSHFHRGRIATSWSATKTTDSGG